MRSLLPLVCLVLAAAVFAIVFGLEPVHRAVFGIALEVFGLTIVHVFLPFLLLLLLYGAFLFYRRILRF